MSDLLPNSFVVPQGVTFILFFLVFVFRQKKKPSHFALQWALSHKVVFFFFKYFFSAGSTAPLNIVGCGSKKCTQQTLVGKRKNLWF